MKLARYVHSGSTRWGVVDTTQASVQPIIGDFADWVGCVVSNPHALELAGDSVSLSAVRLLAPLDETSEVVGIGNNYPAGRVPQGSESPFFFKPLCAIANPGDELRFPDLIRIQQQCRFCYEIELVIVLGAPLVDGANALGSVLGYTIGNDGWVKGIRPSLVQMDVHGSKGGELSSALGPWITTIDEVGPNPDLRMTSRVNGTVTQTGRTGDMILGVADVLNALVNRMRLEPGDVVFTGTCGNYLDPLAGAYYPGDAIELEIESLGVLANSIPREDPYFFPREYRWNGGASIPGFYPRGPVGTSDES